MEKEEIIKRLNKLIVEYLISTQEIGLKEKEAEFIISLQNIILDSWRNNGSE